MTFHVEISIKLLHNIDIAKIQWFMKKKLGQFNHFSNYTLVVSYSWWWHAGGTLLRWTVSSGNSVVCVITTRGNWYAANSVHLKFPQGTCSMNLYSQTKPGIIFILYGFLREHDMSIYIPWRNLDLYWNYYEWFHQGTRHFNLHSLRKPGLILNGCFRIHDLFTYISWGNMDLYWYYYEWLPQGTWNINIYSPRKPFIVESIGR